MKTSIKYDEIEEIWLNAITAGKGVFPDDDSIDRFAQEVVRARSEKRGNWFSSDDVRNYLIEVKNYSDADAEKFIEKFVCFVNAREKNPS